MITMRFIAKHYLLRVFHPCPWVGILCLLTLICFPVKSDASDKLFGVIIASKLNVRPLPSKQQPPIKTLQRGSRVEILSRDSGWLKIKHAGVVGYVKDEATFIQLYTLSEKSSKKPSAGRIISTSSLRE